MIYTCTITPSIDYTTYLPTFKAGALNRADEVYYYPGGKGINVSRVLQRLGRDSIALGFAGGFTGDYIKQFLSDESIQTDFTETNQVTRINVKVKADTESELNGPGPTIEGAQLEELLQKVKNFKQGDWFVLAGSLPESIPSSFFEELAAACRENGVHFVLDTSGSALKQLVQTKPFLIKPNEHELGELFDTTISNKAEAVYYAKQLVAAGLEHVIVSMGGEGAILVTNNLVLTAESPKGTVVNTVGAGDSLVSGFLASYMANKDAAAAFRYGVASGSATAFQTDLCKETDVEALLSNVLIKNFDE
ncbi:1-phosphofructokinase [Virgibacillus natechei]|uniref:Tagatose-6-phosphate kinase n=1 Tax=Virgibacillus natechei TaxID=1216297 RepID=A0ABS4IC28_9BACI|nr:1-phosphofructokinase [Virgibacillus natechei]MBP1968493.1 1-phosphofructokinase [Virgibacillus natechei]UZD13611.1 1-phosphofructokinase [Virgibacillus natechei]